MKITNSKTIETTRPVTATHTVEKWQRTYIGEIRVQADDFTMGLTVAEARSLAEALMESVYAFNAMEKMEAAEAAAALKRERDAEAEANA